MHYVHVGSGVSTTNCSNCTCAVICRYSNQVTSYFVILYFSEYEKQKARAQDRGDLEEEAKACSAVAELLTQNGKN